MSISSILIPASSQVDRHIRRVDSDLSKHEESLSLGLRPGTVPSSDAREAQAQAMENATARARQNPSGTLGGGKGHMNRTKEIAADDEMSLNSLKRPGRNDRKKKGRKDRTQRVVNQYVPPEGWQPVPQDVFIDANEVGQNS